MANMAEKIGARYRNETAVAADKYFIEAKKSVIDEVPVMALKTNNFFSLPQKLSFNREKLNSNSWPP